MLSFNETYFLVTKSGFINQISLEVIFSFSHFLFLPAHLYSSIHGGRRPRRVPPFTLPSSINYNIGYARIDVTFLNRVAQIQISIYWCDCVINCGRVRACVEGWQRRQQGSPQKLDFAKGEKYLVEIHFCR